jgi:hypothetical protein
VSAMARIAVTVPIRTPMDRGRSAMPARSHSTRRPTLPRVDCRQFQVKR